MSQKGGGVGRTIPTYKDTRNTPFQSTESKQIDKKRFEEIPFKPKSNPIIEFKLNDNLLKGHQVGNMVPPYKQIYPSPYVPIEHPMPTNYPYVTGVPNYYPWQFTPNNVPYIKNYNISLAGPSGDHTRVSDLYEDMLPGNAYNNTFNTLGERLTTYSFVRNVLIRQGDGEDIDINGKGKNYPDRLNLLSYVKFMELNPYHNDKLTNNPYKSLPDRLLIYRSCYPIRMDRVTNQVTCAKHSLGMNIRIYEMIVGELKVLSTSENIDADKYDLCREINYYEYIREEVIKKMVCPNFCILYCYYISSNTQVDFEKLRSIKRKHLNDSAGKVNKSLSRKLNDLYHDEIFKQLGLKEGTPVTLPDMSGDASLPPKKKDIVINSSDNFIDFIRNDYVKMRDNNIKIEITKKNLLSSYKFKGLDNKLRALMIEEYDKLKKKSDNIYKDLINKLDINSVSGKCLIALTDAPNCILTQWATKTYQFSGTPIKKMDSTGYHDEKVWWSIMFQLLVGLHVLQIKNIAINNMTMDDNIYIKDLQNVDRTVGYWKYIINGINYYIPNYGYMVLIDTNFKDLPQDDYTIKRKNYELGTYKIYGQVASDFDPSDSTKKNLVDKTNYENLKKIINSNNFGKEFTNYGGISPPEPIIALLGSMNQYINDPNRKQDGKTDDLINKYMRRFLHNRIGCYLSDDEDKFVVDEPNNDIKSGELCIYTDHNKANKWALCIDIHNYPNITILTKDKVLDKESIEIVIAIANTKKYKKTTDIAQVYKSNEAKLAEEDLLETYIIN